MTLAEDVTLAAVDSDEKFQEALKKALKELGMSVSEFAKVAKISPSTLYKVVSEKREPNLKTLRRIVMALKELERSATTPFIAVIASRPFLNEIAQSTLDISDKEIPVREYPANSMEDAIVAAIRAERNGAAAIVCAPIVSPTIERVVKVPIVTIMPMNGLYKAIEIASEKVF
ncbi:MAG: helix-turn-helix domain-containing protein [Candidatus Hydrothermarchaeales archaeon]